MSHSFLRLSLVAEGENALSFKDFED